ncbi:hypothetical protein E2C01_097634 [Portunus trituberculatus]|uniref:Uncharacterized protein n=1 Tax=Portunus trituberculatus TaxID=210409 RepID=A0A5B7KA52_PORTR|nr:hypothetical protein [Portunus trituberculatus]
MSNHLLKLRPDSAPGTLFTESIPYVMAGDGEPRCGGAPSGVCEGDRDAGKV